MNNISGFSSHDTETTPSLSRLDLAHLYACSAPCDHSSSPCAECTKPRTPTLCPLARTAPRISRPIRRPLRRLYAYWLAALRTLVLERLSHPRLLPTRTGVLVCPPDNPTGEWGKAWLEPARYVSFWLARDPISLRFYCVDLSPTLTCTSPWHTRSLDRRPQPTFSSIFFPRPPRFYLFHLARPQAQERLFCFFRPQLPHTHSRLIPGRLHKDSFHFSRAEVSSLLRPPHHAS
jgi:hypothetical protein